VLGVMTIMTIDHVQIAMPVAGEAAARQFFGVLLGLAEIPKPADMVARGGCWFAVGDLQIHLGVEADFRPARKAHVALRTDALADLKKRLISAGHVVHDDIPVDGHSRFFTADPFGNRIEFVEGFWAE
jgi:catechol 2,3-dioxygenase-like lactoylglutathione lyase family enzyme